AGLVTNDTFAALRSLGARNPGSSRTRRLERGGRPIADSEATEEPGAPRRRRLPRGWWRQPGARSGGIGGRWSLVRDLMFDDVTSTERAHAWAATLLKRHGIVARETGQIEALGGGLGSVYSVLRSMEEAGRIRRGYFVEGLGGSQFAYPGVVDRLRRERDAAPEGIAVALAATDPANPYGWLLPWPPVADDEGSR